MSYDRAFWDDHKDAQSTMKSVTRLRDTVSKWRRLESQSASLLDLLDLAIKEDDDELSRDIYSEAQVFYEELEKGEIELTLSGIYDQRPAILSIHAGAGGVDSQDWSKILLRMYTRWSENQGYDARILDLTPGEEGGVKNVVIEFSGTAPYGYLKSEKGVHRLVRLSPFNSDHLRHTSFAHVEVLPAAANEDVEIQVRPEDIKSEFFRSSGPGGQNVNKLSSAVRITHISTGIVVACQTERSQHQNREYAMMILKARLLQNMMDERAKTAAEIKGARVPAEFGNQIRSYVLHPYKMVKDHRTNYQTSDAEGVLDGHIDGFLNAYLVHSVERS